MEYRLISNGRLVAGADEAKVLARLEELTGLAEADIRAKLLSGKRAKLKTETDPAKIQALYDAFIEAGLDVEIESTDPRKPRRAPGQRTTTKTGKRRWIALGAAVLMLLAGAASYLWYRVNAPLPPQVHTTEAALADGHLVAIGHLDAGKLRDLNRYLFGAMDPQALPVGSNGKDMLQAFLDGPADLRARLDQLFIAVHAPADNGRPTTSMLLSGRFDKTGLLDTFKRFYRLDQINNGPWFRLQTRPQGSGGVCSPEEPGSAGSGPMYLFVDSHRAFLVTRHGYGLQLLERLQTHAEPAQPMTQWKRYRKGRLASVMVRSLPEASAALGGLRGMMAQQAASQHPEISGVAVAVAPNLLARGLDANLSVLSTNTQWKRNTIAKLQRKIDALKKDTRKVTPTLGRVMSRLELSPQPEALAIDVTLESELLDQISQIFRETMGSLFRIKGGPGGQQEAVTEKIDSSPTDYPANAAFAALPDLKLKSYENRPMYKSGPFAIDLGGIRKKNGLIEVRLQGKVALPRPTEKARGKRTGRLVLSVHSVTDAAGNELMRDERCIEPERLDGRSRNQEPETSSSLFGDYAQITKHIRLRKNIDVDDIHRIQGRIRFSAPVAVRRFPVTLQAGETVEHAGLRFYLSSVTDHSVSYQLSGETDRLLEVRAFNTDGKPLRQGWRMGNGDTGRATQHYQGKIHRLAIFVNEKSARHTREFQLAGLFAPPDEEGQPSPDMLAPDRIAAEAWEAYKRLDVRELEVDRSHWLMAGDNKSAIAEAHWSGVSMYVTHTPKQWGNNPRAHVYFPMLTELPGVLSAFSYRIDEPSSKKKPTTHYRRITYPYHSDSLEFVVRHRLEGRPIAVGNWPLRTSLEANERLDRLAGRLVFRLPTETTSHELALDELWPGKTVDGITVTLTEVNRGTFPGYSLKVEGEIARLVNLHGLDADGRRVAADPINYQQAGYWTMTLPFGEGIENVELVLADEQAVMEYPFSLTPSYPVQ